MLWSYGDSIRAERAAVRQDAAPEVNPTLLRLFVRNALSESQRVVVQDLVSLYDSWFDAAGRAFREFGSESN